MNHERAIARERGGKEGEGGCIGTRDRARLTFILRQGVLQLRRRRKRREEGQRRLRTSNHGKLNSVAPSVPLNHSNAHLCGGLPRSSSCVALGRGTAAMAFVLMALHALLVARLREEDEERGMAGKEGGRALTTLYAKSAASSSSASTIDGRTAAEDRKMTAVRASSCRRLCTLCTRRPTCNPRGGKILRDGCSAGAAVCPSVL